ncbi:YybH family protein [Granulicella arctica]|uniref:YybH family protein n=1 Tax=Granulicella arctica TaxID=940613 RepID=UPI0021E00916|nr:DUF4440 domain-containing protein [Granulicella arctica]
MLRRIVPALALSVFLHTVPASLQAQLPPQAPLHTATQQELDVVKVLIKQENAWNKGDINKFTEAYKDSPDTLFISRTLSRGYTGMIAEYHQNYPTRASMGTLSFSELEVHRLDDNFAVCIGKYHLERGKKDGGNAEGLFSLVFEKTAEGWKIVVDHTT